MGTPLLSSFGQTGEHQTTYQINIETIDKFVDLPPPRSILHPALITRMALSALLILQLAIAG